MFGPRATRTPSLAGLAWGGMLLAHCLAYLVAYPSAAARGEHLLLTGHGSFGVLVFVATGVVPVALSAILLRSVAAPAPVAVRRTALGLAAIQLPLFAFLELVERNLSVSGALADPAVWVGFAAQVLVAVLLAVLLALMVGVVRRVAGCLRRPRPARALPPRPALRAAVRRAAFLIHARRRAPPLPLAT